MESQRFDLATFLRAHEFDVPDFQRPFSWGAEQIDALWEDLTSVSGRSAKPLFLGSIVVEKLRGGRLKIWDGQQRICCVTMLLCSFRDWALSQGNTQFKSAGNRLHGEFVESSSLSPGRASRLLLGELDRQSFSSYVFAKLGDPAKRTRDSWDLLSSRERDERWNRKLVDGYLRLQSTINEYLDHERSKGKLRPTAFLPLVRSFLDRASLILITAGDENEAFDVFETLNDRGLELSASDLIKNYILSRARHRPLRSELKRQWDAILQQVGNQALTNFIRFYYVSKFDRTTKANLYRNVKKICPGRPPAGLSIRSLVSELGDQAPFYRRFTDPSENDWNGEEAPRILRSLSNIGAVQWVPMMLAVSDTEPDESQIEVLLQAIESLYLRKVVVGGSNPNQLEKLFGQLARDFRTNAREAHTRARARAEFIPTLAQSLKDQTPNDESFLHDFNALRWSDRSTVLTVLETLERYLQSQRATGVAPQVRVIDIEHVYPREPGADWPTTGPESVAPEEREMMGNLALLHKKPNRELQNGPFEEKRQAYRLSSLLLTREITRCRRWGPREIKRRQQRLANLALEAWPR